MGYEIIADQENGWIRLESKLGVLDDMKFSSLDLALEPEPQRFPARQVRRLSRQGKILDMYAASPDTPVAINDIHYLIYTLQPSGVQLPEHKLGDRDYHYTDRARFERLQYCVLANILRKIYEKANEKDAKVTLRMPGEEPREVNEELIAELSDEDAIAELRSLLGEEFEGIQDEDIVPVITTSIQIS